MTAFEAKDIYRNTGRLPDGWNMEDAFVTGGADIDTTLGGNWCWLNERAEDWIIVYKEKETTI